MATRRYQQRLRAESAEDTRRRILDAVHQRLREAPSEPLSLDQVATLARVARSTIYTTFGSRAGLFDNFVEHLWQRAGLPELTAAVGAPDARTHLRGGIRASTRMYAAERDVYRVLFAMARLDPASVGGAVDKINTERAGGMAHVARRLHDQHLLRPGVTIDEAADTLWVLTSFEAYDLLATDRGLDTDHVADLLITTAEHSLLRPGG